MILSFKHKGLRKFFEIGSTAGIQANHAKRLRLQLAALDTAETIMSMHNPPHPGEFITGVYLEPHGISGRELALKLDVSPSTLSRILNGSSRVTPEMALRLAKAIGRSPESWLAMQDAHDLWIARKKVDLRRVGKLRLAKA